MSTQQARSKPWWRTLLTPGWVITAILVATFSYFAFTFLAPWQLGKNEALEERNEHIVEAFEHDPVPIDTVLSTDGTIDPDREWTRVLATGHYLDTAEHPEVLLRLRPVDRTPAFQVLTPFALENGQTIVVNRGWVPAQESTKVPTIDAPPTTEVTITAMMRLDEGAHPREPMQDQGYQMVHSIHPPQVAELTGTYLASPYLQLAGGEPGVLNPIPLPQLETGNHLSYGLQWILFGILAPAGLFYFLFAETRERRRFAREQQELAGAVAAAGAAAAPAETGAVAGAELDSAAAEASAAHAEQPAAPAEPEPAPAVASRSRYGHTRRNPWAQAYDRQQDRTR